jgi:predicted RNA methylase
MIPKGSKVLDLACGCGYGSWIMHNLGLEVTGADIEPEAISYAEKNYPGPTYRCQSAEETKGSYDALVTFETLEHLNDPGSLLKAVQTPLVIASVPNEERMPFRREKFAGDKYPHKRHYTPDQFEELLKPRIIEGWYCQKHKFADVTPGKDGMFLVVVAR